MENGEKIMKKFLAILVLGLILIKPASWIKGNKMGFAGLKKEEDRASVILYLNQNSDSPKELP